MRALRRDMIDLGRREVMAKQADIRARFGTGPRIVVVRCVRRLVCCISQASLCSVALSEAGKHTSRTDHVPHYTYQGFQSATRKAPAAVRTVAQIGGSGAGT